MNRYGYPDDRTRWVSGMPHKLTASDAARGRATDLAWNGEPERDFYSDAAYFTSSR